MTSRDPVAIPIRPRSALILALASLAGLVMFLWPLLVKVNPEQPTLMPPFFFLLLLPVVVLVCLAEFTEGGMDSKVLAMLGVLTAINGVMRGLGAGTAGVEMVFFLLILSGRVFGPAFGFALGVTSIFASAIITAGVGTWLPYQMMVSGWIGLGAGLLPRRVSGKAEMAMLIGYGIFAAYVFGLIMNMSGWPYLLGATVPGQETSLAFVPGDPIVENLKRFGIYTLLTSTTSWDTGRAITNTIALMVLGPAILTTLRRAVRRATVVTGDGARAV
jgi:energy-coupling factor transport system substrate-specific component